VKRLIVTLIVVLIALAGKVSLAQEAAGLPAEIVKELDSIVGTWETKGKVGDKDQTGKFTLRWARTEDKRKVCLFGRFSYKVGDTEQSGVTLIGWNAARKCIEDRGFDANGGCDVLYWTVKSPTEWQGEELMVEGGKEIKGKIRLVKKTPTEFLFEATMENGVSSSAVMSKVKEEPKR
jgi:hypothetical protein